MIGSQFTDLNQADKDSGEGTARLDQIQEALFETHFYADSARAWLVAITRI